MQESTNNTLILGVVVLLHGLVLGWALQQLSVRAPETISPSVVGVLIALEHKPAPPQATQSEPVQPNPKPALTTQPEPVSKPVPVRANETVAKEEPLAQQTVQENTTKPSAAVPASASSPLPNITPAAESPAVVSPPRTDAAHLKNPAPQYPALSRRLGEQGVVMLDVYILPDGSVGEIKLNQSSGFVRLDYSALKTVKTWTYVPARRGDKPIAFWYVQPVSFVLNNQENLN